MRKKSNSTANNFSVDSKKSMIRCSTPSEVPQSLMQKDFLPYPLYKQKIRALLKPPDYSRQPPVFMSGRETRPEFERKEASTQVKLLKKTFNMMYQRYDSFEKTIRMLKSEAIRVNALRSVGESDLGMLQRKIDCLQGEENVMLAKIREETFNNLSCKHIRERMRQTLMHLEVKNQYLQGQIRLRDFLIESEHRKKIKTSENKFTSVQTFRHLTKTVGLDLKDRGQDLNLLKEDIESREKIHELRQKRIKKYEEIAETAANEERDLKSNKMREIVLISAMWAKQLDYRYTMEKKNSEHLERAFQKIKAATLIEKVEDVLIRFLLKEDRFTDLMVTLNKNKEKCMGYLRKNDLIEAKIDELLLAQKTYTDVNVSESKKNIHALMQKINAAKERQRKLRLIYEVVKEWGVHRLQNQKNYEKVPVKIIFQELHVKIKSQTSLLKSPFITEISNF